ncbi:MAG: helix-turn-helix domain-containing protein [Erysipelotrichales bacterium]|nr:helix-turn-helix domain-containing protein [Erysipelotrichales bacterium]
MNIVTANKLFELRKKSGLSQEELADKIGVSRQAVSKWERAEASPDTDNLIALANLYNISLDELIGKEEVNEKKVLDEKTNNNHHDNDEKDPDEEVDGDGRKNHLGWIDASLLFVALIAMFLLGFLGDFWSWSWLTILVWIVVTSLINAIEDKKVNHFNYPVFITTIYLFMGLTIGIWHPTWILFITIPPFYIIANAKDSTKK